MSSITASPGKENSKGGEKSAATKELENLLDNAKEIHKSIVESTTAKADTAMDSSDGSGFNVLGGDAPTVSQLVTNLELGMKLIKEHDQALAKNTISVIESLSRAKDITTTVQSLCNTISVLYNKLEDGSKITACFEKFSSPLAALLELVKTSKHFKDLVNIATQTSLVMMKRFETLSSGPYESSLLSSIESFLICCINHTNAKLRLGVVALWKTTFANSKELTYSDKLTPVLLATAKRHSMFLPGLSSVESMEEAKTPSSKTPNTYKIRSTKKRLALLDEDSVDYVPIAPSTSAKKMKLTDHQKEVFAATRDKIPLMDEDSRQPGSLPKSLAEQFDMEASQSGSQSNQAKKLAKEATSALLANTEIPKEKEVIEPLVESTDDRKETQADKEEEKPKEIEEKMDEKKPDSTKEVKTENQPKEGFAERNDEVAEKKARGQPSQAKPTSTSEVVSDTKESTERKPRARRSLKMTASEGPVVEEDAKESSDDIGSISSYVESSSETSQDSTEYVPQKRSRRSQAKGTPSKFVAKPRAVKNLDKTKEETPKKKRGRKPKKLMEKDAVVEQEKDEEPKVVDEVEKESKVEPVKVEEVEKADEPMEVEEAKKKEEKPVSVEETKGDVASSSEDEVQIIGELFAVDSKDKSPEVITTPMKKDDRLERPSSAIIRTPGILKQPGTPSTHEKGHRVHFCPETVLNKEERNAIVATPKRTVETEEDRKRNNNPVFPELMNCTEPVTKIIDKLLPYGAHGAGSVLLRGALEQKKISTIGGLARATGKEISSLPVKSPRYDTVRSALTAFAISNGLLEAPEPAKGSEVIVLEKPSSPSPALQEAEKSPTQEKLKELELTANDEDGASCSSSSSTFQKFLNDVKRVSSSFKEVEKDIAGWSSNEIKQLLNTTNAAMTDLTECQKKLFAHLV